VITHDRERLELTGSIEWQPDDATHFELDGLIRAYHEQRQEMWSEVLFRSNEKGISVATVYDGAGNMISRARSTMPTTATSTISRSRIPPSTSFPAPSDHEFTDRLKINVLAGASSRCCRCRWPPR
jgi:hypothetical protein